jgi:1-acyl-sn-glycerol-3-phosphate acyltransferase
MTEIQEPTPAPPAAPAAPASSPPPDEPTRLESSITPLIATLAFGGRIFARGMSRIHIEGDLGAIPREGPVIIAANHASNFDPVVLGAWLTPALGRRIQWLGKKELFAWPVVGWAARNGGVHPVDRGAADAEAFRLAKRILDEGHVLFVFPEGTRSADGALHEARDGVAVLALRTGAAIVPIGISGSNGVWPRGQKLPHPGGRVTVRVGEAFRLADVLPPDIDRKTAKGLATDVIMRRIAALLPPAQQGVYGGPNGDPVR